MEVKVLMNGTEVMAELVDEDFDAPIKQAERVAVFRDIIFDMIDDFYVDDEFSEEEIDNIFNKVLYDKYNERDIISKIASGELKHLVDDACQFEIDNRVRYFEVRVNYSGTFNVIVKAKSKDEAIDYIEDGNVDFDDYINMDDAYIETDGVAHEYDYEPCGDAEIIEVE